MIRRALLLAVPLFFAGCVSSVYFSAQSGDTATLQSLLDQGASPNEGIQGQTPLMQAASMGHVEAVRLLLDKGAEIDAVNGHDDTALTYAVWSGRADVVALLVERGAEVRERERTLAEQKGFTKIGELLAAPEEESGQPDETQPEPEPAAKAAPTPRQPPVSDVDSPKRRGAARPDDFALIVGVEGYDRLPAATHAERDTDAVKAHVLALGIPERNIVLLKGKDGARSRLAAYLEEWLPKNVKPASRVLFYYSGHGAPDPRTGEAYLVPWDGDPTFLQSTAYPVRKLYASLAALKAKRVVVALDACFSGAGGRSVLAQGARPLVTKTESMRPATGLTVLAAASGDEITGSLDAQGHGLFTYFLLKGLDEGKASAAALFEYLKPRVQDEAHRQNREQTPVFMGEDAPL